MEKEMELNTGNQQALTESGEHGATMLEYCLLAALIAVVVIAALTFLGQEVSQTFSEIGSTIGDAS